MSRASKILDLIEAMDPENEKRHSLKGQPSGYRYQDRDEIDGGTNVEYADRCIVCSSQKWWHA